MTFYEKYSWGSLIGTGIILVIFIDRMIDGGGLVDYDAAGLFWLYLGIVIAAIVMEVTVNIVATASGGRRGGQKDERDREIEAKSGRIGNWIVVAAVNIGLFSMLAGNAFDAFVIPLPLGVNMSDSPEALVFFLFAAMFLGTLTERLAAIIYYRQ